MGPEMVEDGFLITGRALEVVDFIVGYFVVKRVWEAMKYRLSQERTKVVYLLPGCKLFGMFFRIAKRRC